MNWKNLRNNPPIEDCTIVIGLCNSDNRISLYRTYLFFADTSEFVDTSRMWDIKTVADFDDERYYYINLDEIKLG